MNKMKKIVIEKNKLHLLPVIHGLAGEDAKVRDAFEKVKPDCIAIGVAPEDIEIMSEIEGNEEFEISLQHQYYLMHLSKYGKVSIPPSDIKTACEIAHNHNIPLETIDINDEEYAELITKNVSIFALLKHSRKIKKMAKKKFKAKTAEEFVYEWDNEINTIKSFKKIEEEREEKMIFNLIELCKKYEKILAIIPLEKYDGLVRRLERYKKSSPITPQ